MKSVYVGDAAFALTAAVNLSPALAEGQKLSGGNAWPGMSQPLTTSSSAAVTTAGHYQYRYTALSEELQAQRVLFSSPRFRR